MIATEYLFIGGLRDGQCHEIVRADKLIQVATSGHIMAMPFQPDIGQTTGVHQPIHQELYIRESIRGSEKTFTFYMHNSLHIDQAIQMLIDSYKSKTKEGAI